MSQKSDIETIEEAAAILDGEALTLRQCSTLGPDNNDWTGEDDALATYKHWKQIVDQLYALAERMGGKRMTKETNMEYELKRGQALVITGPQGCGKSTLARKIAEQHGTFVEAEIAVLEDKFGMADVLHSEPETLIMDGFTTSEKDMKRIKSMITNDMLRVDRQHQVSVMVKTPNLIFCSGEANPLLLADGDRRFRVVSLAERMGKTE